MKDFTFTAYRRYLEVVKSSYSNILRFDEFLNLDSLPDSFFLIRHDVDRRPQKAVFMARLENEMGIKSSYYFRAKPNTFKKKIIEEISNLGHEIGYHYECLSDTNGDITMSMKDFENNLEQFRKIVSIKTISMHGRPFKSSDNRDMWRPSENHSLLSTKFGISGEVYLDIDYTEIAYINDTGRNWDSSLSNKRDKVISSVKCDFRNGEELYHHLKEKYYPKIVFQIHPERWSDSITEYYTQLLMDTTVNFLKRFL